MSNTPKPQANGLDDKELIKRIDAIYDESRQMAVLRIGSPICFLRKGMLALITEATREARIDELEKVYKEASTKMYSNGVEDFVADRLTQLKENK